jgi:hypothetical protein
MDWSSVLFMDQVWPVIKKHVGGGELMRMEGRPDIELAQKLDMLSGIDGWHIHQKGMRGIASRVQQGVAYNTFTIRTSRDSGAETEYAKRVEAISSNSGWIFPHLTVQAYVRTKEGPILSVGLAKTSDIIEFINKGLHKMKRTSNADFAVCDWEKMKNCGYKVIVALQST